MATSPSSPVRPPTSGFRSPLPHEGPKESAFSRLLIAPLTFLSFLLSLALIDSRNHSLRTHFHSPSRAPPTTFLGHIKAFLHSLIYKAVPSSPYAYIKSPNPRSTLLNNGKEEREQKEPWHWHTKQRHMMKAEMEDAFRVRKWVVMFLVVFGVMAAGGGVLVVRWVCWAWRNWGREVSGPIHINSGKAIFYGRVEAAREWRRAL